MIREGWYNTRRRHSTIDNLAPIEFEGRYSAATVESCTGSHDEGLSRRRSDEAYVADSAGWHPVCR